MRFKLGGLVITATRDEPRYEVQDTDADGRMAWFSGPDDLGRGGGYLTRETAVMIATQRPLPSGWKRVVRHVGDGTVAYKRGPVHARAN